MFWFPSGVAVSMRDAAKALLFEGVKAGCNALFAWQAGHFLTLTPTCLQRCRKSFCATGAIPRNSSGKNFCRRHFFIAITPEDGGNAGNLQNSRNLKKTPESGLSHNGFIMLLRPVILNQVCLWVPKRYVMN